MLSVPQQGPAAHLLLAFGVLAGAVMWAARLVGSYVIVAVACPAGLIGPQVLGITALEAVLHLVTLSTAGVTVAAGVISWLIWRRSGVNGGPGPGGIPGRNAFLGLAGILMSVLFLAVILLEGSAVLLNDVC
jgi:hypothetical protein